MAFNTNISVAILIAQRNIFDAGSKAQNSGSVRVKPA